MLAESIQDCRLKMDVSTQIWRRGAGVEPTDRAWRNPPGLKPGRPTGDASLPCSCEPKNPDDGVSSSVVVAVIRFKQGRAGAQQMLILDAAGEAYAVKKF